MITHDDESIQLPFTTMDGFKKSLLKSFGCFEVSEQILSIVTSAYDVVNGTWKLYPLFSWHAKTTTLVPLQVNVNVLRLTPFTFFKSFGCFEVSEQILSIVTSAYDVVNGTGKLHPLFSWHARTTTLVPLQVNVNVLRLTPFPLLPLPFAFSFRNGFL